MKKIILFFVVFLLLPTFSAKAQTQSWYYPIGNFAGRSQYKTFNQYIDKNFYIGKESLFPTQYTGYHAADDLEILPGEENTDVPVYAVTDGTISFIGPVTGYGGVILINLANDSHTALYGHVRISSSPVKAGDSVKAGQKIAVLGKGFSSETGGERKHLHFGIYNGKGSYFKGYESSESVIQSKWIDPAAYLKEKGAVDVSSQSSVTSLPAGKAGGQQGNTKAPVAQNNDKVGQSQLNTNISQPVVNSPAQGQSEGILNAIIKYLESLYQRMVTVL